MTARPGCRPPGARRLEWRSEARFDPIDHSDEAGPDPEGEQSAQTFPYSNDVQCHGPRSPCREEAQPSKNRLDP